MRHFSTADIADEFPDQVAAIELPLRNYGALSQFHGAVVTIKCHADNSLVKALVGKPGEGRVILVDGGGSRRRALLGDMLAKLGKDNDWAGIIVYGCIRDSAVIANIGIGVKALNTNPRKSVKKGVGERDIAVSFADVIISPGDYIYADDDGFVVSEDDLAEGNLSDMDSAD